MSAIVELNGFTNHSDVGKLRPLDRRNGGLSAANWFIRTPNSRAACCPKMAVWSAMRWHSDRKKETTFLFISPFLSGAWPAANSQSHLWYTKSNDVHIVASPQSRCFFSSLVMQEYTFCTLATASTKRPMDCHKCLTKYHDCAYAPQCRRCAIMSQRVKARMHSASWPGKPLRIVNHEQEEV